MGAYNELSVNLQVTIKPGHHYGHPSSKLVARGEALLFLLASRAPRFPTMVISCMPRDAADRPGAINLSFPDLGASELCH